VRYSEWDPILGAEVLWNVLAKRVIPPYANMNRILL
jgi:hypothetical protein